MEFYSASDYRKILNFLVERQKAIGIDCNFAKVAEAIRVQRPYLSKVMNGSADLSEDQLHLVCEYFEISGDEKNYLELLLQYSKSGLKERKDFLKKQIQQLQSIKLDIKNNIEAEKISPTNVLFTEYFLNPQMQIAHVALNVKRFQNLEVLASVLNLTKKSLAEILNKLELLKLIEFKNNRFIVINQSLHLPKDSNLIHPHQTLLRVKSIEHQQNKSHDSGNYAFSVTFSCDEEGRKKIQEDFIKYLKSVQKTVQAAGTEEVYQINFDLFSWTK
jgi:transcriptional regulator with XRE-family HTH domain